MNNIIHPTALVSPQAKIGSNNYIGPFCIVGPNVTMGDGNRFEAYSSIGTAGEHRDYFRKEPGPVVIGNNNNVREYVTLNGGTKGVTTIGSNVTILRGSHVGHDAVIRDFANLSCNVLIGGHTLIGQGANLGLAAVVHQLRAVGAYAMIGMNSTVTRNCPPFLIAFGTPLRPNRINRIGIQRSGVPESELAAFEAWFQSFEETGAMGKINHRYQSFLDQYLADCQSFQPAPVKTPSAA